MIFELFPLICLNSCISRNTIYMDFQVYVPKIMYDNIYYPFNVCRLIAMSSFIPNTGYSYFLSFPQSLLDCTCLQIIQLYILLIFYVVFLFLISLIYAFIFFFLILFTLVLICSFPKYHKSETDEELFKKTTNLKLISYLIVRKHSAWLPGSKGKQEYVLSLLSSYILHYRSKKMEK